MGQMIVESFTVKADEQGNPKKDNYGNTQMMIKFTEHPETVYKAVKDPSTITKGKVMYGQVVEGQYGFKFQADPYGQAPASAQQAQQTTITQLAGNSELAEIKKIVLATYKAVTGEEYAEVKKETTPAPEAVTEPVDGEEIDLGKIPF